MKFEVVLGIGLALNGVAPQLRLWYTARGDRKLFVEWTAAGLPDEVFDRYSRLVAARKSGRWQAPWSGEPAQLQLVRGVDTPPTG